MFRASAISDQDGRATVLKVEGRLVGAWVDELAQAVSVAMTEAAQVTLDLDGLSFVDARGVELLRNTAARGARLIGGSAFVTTLIRQDNHHDDISG